jgi:hypothetical protein
MPAVLTTLRKVRLVRFTAAVASALVLAVAGTACGGEDSETDAGGGSTVQGNTGQKNVKAPKEIERQEKYNTAFEQCKRIGAEALRANYGTKGPLDLLAQIYVTQNAAYFDPYQQEAIRGCTVGLSR